MKKTFIYFSLAAITISFLLASCGHSRVWATKEKQTFSSPVARTSYYAAPLIISPTPGFTMNRHPNGQYFHRGQQGLLYWKGYDNRFYLDRNYINKTSYSKWEYKEWKRYSKNRNTNFR